MLVRRDRLRRGRFAAQLHKSHSGNDDHQGDPLSKGQLAIEEEDGEQSGGEDLHLVGYRVDCRVQMGDGHEKEIVLHCVKKGGNEQEESVLPLQEHFLEDDLAVRLAPEEYLQSLDETHLHTVENSTAKHFQALRQNHRRRHDISETKLRNRLLLLCAHDSTIPHHRYLHCRQAGEKHKQ